MHTQSQAELRRFLQFVDAKVNNGCAPQSPEEVLDEWRALHPDPEDVAAIQEAIDDMENGDAGMPFDEFDRDFRQRHGLPTTT